MLILRLHLQIVKGFFIFGGAEGANSSLGFRPLSPTGYILHRSTK